MPTSEAPASQNQQNHAAETGAEARPEEAPGICGSGPRWVDYDTHELLEMISELEDELRWARLREGVLWAILAHILLISGITWIPTYVLREPKVIDPFDAIKQRKDLTYLDMPPDALKAIKPKPEPRPLKEKPLIDKKTLDELNRENPPAPPKQEQQQQQPEQPKPQAAPPIPPSPQSHSQVEAPRPAAVPARPNFAALSRNPVDQLHENMLGSMHSHGSGTMSQGGSGGLRMHPGAGSGGVQILSDTQGVDFNPWLAAWYYETRRTWDPLIPDEVNPPISKQGQALIRFKVLPNGRLMEHSMTIDGRSGDTALDRAAWGAIQGSSYPPLPRDFHGPYLELRALFLYNMQPPQ